MSGSIGGVDASIPLRAGQGVTQNPLAGPPGQFLGTLNTLNSLKLFPLVQQQNQLQIQQQQQAISGQKLQQDLTRRNAAMGYMLPLLLDQNGQPTTGIAAKDIARAIADASDPDSGIMTSQQGVGLLRQLPEGGADPAKNRQWLLQLYGASRAAAGQAEAALAQLGLSPATRDNGQGIISGGVSGPLTAHPGAFTPAGAPTQKLLSPGEIASPVAGAPTTAGQPTTESLGAKVQREGGPAAAFLGGAGGTAPATPAAAPLAGAFRPPPAAGSTPTGLPPGTTEAAGLSAGAAHNAFQRGATFQADMFPLLQAQEALKVAPTGRGSEVLQNFRSVLNTVTPNVLRMFSPGSRDEVAAYDEANKYLTQVQTAQPGAARSDQGLNTAGTASPNVHISNDAAQVVLRGLVGLRRMEQAGTLAFTSQTGPDGKPLLEKDYDRFMTKWSTRADPRAYVFDQMAPDQRAALLKDMPATKRSQFLGQVYDATQNGLLTPPQVPNGG